MSLSSAIQEIRDPASLLGFLQQELGWPVDLASLADDVTFEWRAEELRLADEHAERLSGGLVRQLRPFPGVDRQPWGIFLVEFAEERVCATALRQVLRGLVPRRRGRPASLPAWEREDLLFLCATRDYERISFVHFRQRGQRSAVLSRFEWRKGDHWILTLCEHNLPALRFPDRPEDSEGWRRAWAAAFDVEPVTCAFYRRYREIFEEFEARVVGIADADARRLWTQRLFNRLMFIAFIQKKDWLCFEGRADYLAALFEAAERNGESFLSDRLYWTFFAGLGAHADLPYVQSQAELVERRGEVPFLNGGLFEMEDELDQRGAVTAPNAAFEPILFGPDALFNRFNFTVTESTPLDVEVAVDPEMLGKVFEELVTGRHETGSYYTPKPIVSFMCREALKAYLATACGDDERGDALESFVEVHDSSGLAKPEAILDALRRVRVCDPACGSGAYLLGMLHELLDLRACLFAARRLDPLSVYDRKLDIIHHNLYGVDNDPFAVNIARLRLWLSLAVEFEGETPPPLPNLDFKIEVGDSLVGNGGDGPGTAAGRSVPYDVIVTNPPYLSTKRGFGSALLRRRFVTAVGQYDAYSVFIERGLQLLSEAGVYAYIVPKPVLTNAHMAPVRRLMAAGEVRAIADPGQVFAASVEPVIIVGRKGASADGETRIYSAGETSGDDVLVLRRTTRCLTTPAGTWILSGAETRLGDLAALARLPALATQVDITRGVECGKRDPAVTTEEGEGTYPLLRGEDVERFVARHGTWRIRRDGPLTKFKPVELYRGPKLLVRRVANDVIAAVDSSDAHVLNTLYVLRPRDPLPCTLEYLCGLLNSVVVNDYFHAVYGNDDRLFPYIRAEQLGALPVALPTAREDQEVRQLVCSLSKLAAAGLCDGRERPLLEALDERIRGVYERCCQEARTSGGSR